MTIMLLHFKQGTDMEQVNQASTTLELNEELGVSKKGVLDSTTGCPLLQER